jgi:hypothetical protein
MNIRDASNYDHFLKTVHYRAIQETALLTVLRASISGTVAIAQDDVRNAALLVLRTAGVAVTDHALHRATVDLCMPMSDALSIVVYEADPDTEAMARSAEAEDMVLAARSLTDGDY